MRDDEIGTSDNTGVGAGVVLFPDYCYVDAALGDVKFRNNVKRINEIQLPDPPVECYTSMFRFREDFRMHCEGTGSVKNIEDLSCYCDYLWFDIDDNDLEKARADAIELLVRIEAEFKGAAVIFFSGSKGFHIGIPSQSFGAKPRADLPRVFKKMAQKISGDIETDTAIYDKNRLWRLPNSINKKSELYKTPLTYEQLAQLEAERIKELAAFSGRDLQRCAASSSYKFSEAIASLYNNAIYEFEQQKNTKNSAPSLTGAGPNKLCMEKLLRGVDEGKRNEVGIRLADYFKKQGRSKEETLQTLCVWNEKNRPPLPEPETESIVSSAYSGNYDYGCNDLILKEVCSPKCPLRKKSNEKKPVHTSFVRLPDGSLLEMLYDKSGNPQTFFAKFKDGQYEYVSGYTDPSTGILYKPVTVGRIIQSKTIHFPSRVSEYENEALLIQEIDTFIRKYLVVSEFFHAISKYYVLLSWVYDNFTVLPYLRVRGDYGTGKSRFLQTVGSICYKPVFCTGAATVSPIFRLIDTYRGTVVIDESDFTDSDESHRIIKILNSGFQEGFPVLLVEKESANKLEPRAYEVFGPKLISSRHEFKDRALESRCITEIMDRAFNPEIPINLPSSFWDEARQIRNMLLLWRSRKWGKITCADNRLHAPVEPRLAQIMVPLLSIIEDREVREEFIRFMQERNQQIIEERGETLDGKVAEIVCRLWADKSDEMIRVKEITEQVNKNLDNPKYEISNRKTGQILRKTFNMNLEKDRQGTFLVRSVSNQEKLKNIAHKFGIEHPQECSQRSQCSPPVAGQQLTL